MWVWVKTLLFCVDFALLTCWFWRTKTNVIASIWTASSKRRPSAMLRTNWSSLLVTSLAIVLLNSSTCKWQNVTLKLLLNKKLCYATQYRAIRIAIPSILPTRGPVGKRKTLWFKRPLIYHVYLFLQVMESSILPNDHKTQRCAMVRRLYFGVALLTSKAKFSGHKMDWLSVSFISFPTWYLDVTHNVGFSVLL